MLKRKAYERMLDWKRSPSRRALLVTGARQIGKTYLVRRFAEDNYEHLVELNLILDEAARSALSGGGSPRDLLMRISLASESPMVPGKTLIFIDEVQEAPETLTAIKGLVDQGDYDFVLSGSLLGVELGNIRSNPVGYVSTLMMYPMDFEEFCWACGVGEDVFSHLRGCMEDERPVDAFVHERMDELFRRYLVVGGMPDAVSAFVESGNLSAVREVQESIKDWYRTDISKYCPPDQRLKAKDAFDLVPAELNNPNKRFILKDLNEGARFRSYEDAFLWLCHANVALAAFNVDEPKSPLLLSKQRNLFKLFYSDVGALSSSLSRKSALDLLSAAGEVNHGSAYENAVAQELAAHGFDLYYLNSKKHGELDFVVEDRDGNVLPIEVKSGKGYKRHRAMDNVLEVGNYGLEGGYVFGPCNVERRGKVVYLPVYMASLLSND